MEVSSALSCCAIKTRVKEGNGNTEGNNEKKKEKLKMGIDNEAVK